MPHLYLSPEKMFNFVLFPYFSFTLVIKLRNFDFDQFSLIKKDMMSDLNMSHRKMSNFVQFHSLGSL